MKKPPSGRIDFETTENLSCVLMAQLGFFGKTIAKKTGLSVGQVTYRYRRMNVSLYDYRNGVTPYASKVLDMFSRNKREINALKDKITKRLEEIEYAKKTKRSK